MNPNQSSSASSTSPNSIAPDSISRRAYDIWEQEGRPEGGELQHWLQAEQELTRAQSASHAGRTENDGMASGAPTDARPLQGTRAAGAANRGGRRASGSPFPADQSNGRFAVPPRR